MRGYSVLDIYLHAILKDTKESQLVSVVDKMDGFSEALHELLAGNVPFAESVINYLTRTFALDRLIEKYPLIKDLFFDHRNPFVCALPVSQAEDVKSVAYLSDLFAGKSRNARPHTRETVACDTHISMYELWKRVVIENFGVEVLIDQKEFY